MLHRFATFEVDERTRELRADQRTLQLQPRVFDLLVYLIRNRDRVVPKRELLHNVWPEMIVTDASLQRAVSLARTNLAKLGAPDAIRTHVRQGYRFCADQPLADVMVTKPASIQALANAHAAYARGEWDDAIAAWREVDDFEGLTADDLQRWAHAAQCAGRPHDAVPPLERAVAAYTARGDRRKAAWAAILLAQLRVEWREPVLAKGLFHRATRLLDGEPVCREHGYLDLLGAEFAADEGRSAEAILHLRSALRTWQAVNALVEAATVRCRLATLLELEGDPDAAALELAAATKAFQHAGADALLRNCDRLHRALQNQQSGERATAVRTKQ